MQLGTYHYISKNAIEAPLMQRDEPVQAHMLILSQLYMQMCL